MLLRPQVKIEAGGIADNVLPKSGSIKLNFRLLPGQDAAFVRDYLQMVTLKEAAHVSLRQLGTVRRAGKGWEGHGTHCGWVPPLKQACLPTCRLSFIPRSGLHSHWS